MSSWRSEFADGRSWGTSGRGVMIAAPKLEPAKPVTVRCILPFHAAGARLVAVDEVVSIPDDQARDLVARGRAVIVS